MRFRDKKERFELARSRGAELVTASGEFIEEVKIFDYGWNNSSKGRFLFDEKAAHDVMEDFRLAGNDMMIDLEHLSLDTESNAFDPDARGWCTLEVRKDGSLWAKIKSWTSDGMRRLKEKLQRYFSPAFSIDTESKRIESIYNIAICAIPATYNAQPLVEAKRLTGKTFVSLSYGVDMELAKIAVALGLPEGATLDDVLAAIKSLQDGAELADDPPADDPEQEAKALNKLGPKFRGKVVAALAKVPALEEAIKVLKDQQSQSAVTQLIAANQRKLPKHLEKWAAKQSVETLTTFFAEMKEIDEPAPKEPAKTSTEDVTLTADEKRMAASAGQDPAKVLAFKKSQAAKIAAQKEARNG